MHIPVLCDVFLEKLEDLYTSSVPLKKPFIFFDGTLGAGGHSIALAKKHPEIHFFATDIDSIALARAEEFFKKEVPNSKLKTIHTNFTEIKSICETEKIQPDVVLLDLGYSSHQLEDDSKGMSFLKDEPLLMQIGDYETKGMVTAFEILNTWTEKEIYDILWHLGEEPLAYKISLQIVKERALKPIETTRQLAVLVENEYKKKYFKKSTTHPATKTFQALRIAINNELQNINTGIDAVYESLALGGSCMIISFHSIEDRIVKQAYKKYEHMEKVILSPRKPIIPSQEEISHNPRARSAKLRIFTKIA